MKTNPSCPKCHSSAVIKNGKLQDKQRYKCKDCSYQFSRLTPRGHSPVEKSVAITLYTLGLSMRIIGKIIGVSTTSILYWIRDFARKNYQKPEPQDAILIELDEVWHYLHKKKENCGYGKLIAEKLENLSIGNVEDAIKKRFPN